MESLASCGAGKVANWNVVISRFACEPRFVFLYMMCSSLGDVVAMLLVE